MMKFKDGFDEKYKSKSYLHFDGRRIYNADTKRYVSNPDKIAEHSFYPFIHYVSKTEKYYKDEENIDSRPIKIKNRKIMYASHIDNFIYKYYSDKLNIHYNDWLYRHSLDENVIAYRSKEGEKGKSNIDHAADVINKIHKMKASYIMIGDFKEYFDKLDHQQLKDQLCKVLGFAQNDLPLDWYKVFQSLTEYSYYNQKTIHKYCGTTKQLRRKKQYKYFVTPKDFREFKKKYPIVKNQNQFGIPQGTAVSAILLNVYAIDFDAQVRSLVDEYKGIYRRYSDDFIVVVPHENIESKNIFNDIKNKVHVLVRNNMMDIEENKTKIYICKNRQVYEDQDQLLKESRMDYLGFLYDGKNVEMRGKSPYKFYRKAKILIEKAKKVQNKNNLSSLPYRKKIYSLYTDLGITRRPYGNFITYAKKSQQKFDEISPHTNNEMMKQIKSRKRKIEKFLGYRITHE